MTDDGKMYAIRRQNDTVWHKGYIGNRPKLYTRRGGRWVVNRLNNRKGHHTKEQAVQYFLDHSAKWYREKMNYSEEQINLQRMQIEENYNEIERKGPFVLVEMKLVECF